jgi:hydrogenase expression/formation protein HypC
MCLAVPGKIVSISDGLLTMGTVDFCGIRKEICLAYVPEAKEGSFVIVHAGFAISVVDEQQAQEVFRYLEYVSKEGS